MADLLKDIRNCTGAIAIVAILVAQGCTALPAVPAASRTTPGPERDVRATSGDRVTVLKPSSRLATRPDQSPDAVVTIDPRVDALSPMAQEQLRRIAQQVLSDDQISLRLEGYVPDVGSPALNVSMADRAAGMVRQELMSLKVPSRRIQVAAFGSEHEGDLDPKKHWVEIYFIRSRR